MNYKKLSVIAIILFFFVACKKESPIKESIDEKNNSLELLGDSISYIIEGQKIILNDKAVRSMLNAKANRKLDSVVNYVEYSSGDQDAVMFGRTFKFSGGKNGITIMFLKRYTKNETNNAFFVPLNKLDLFSIGEHRYAIDFSKTNTQNGIAIELSGNYYGFQTFSYSSLLYFAPLKAELQSQSKFEITNFQMLKSGKYLLEAKFNASVYHGDGSNIKKIENGYLRLRLDTESLYF
ncbi:hypothetical protein G7074_06795 [Pedobacter sp. HDW13]|uniref:hypothetical protein n=1 Tax=unclassified Pedobacter TaxID=2628915 RepID=UPI000F5AC4EA|nr:MULTISPECIES: hypothetical protein [unclassified Pedobacter]QIL39017.1 hypothetical protein G7074_06795 [Pedobacter sp. HDW13]RQO72656.1 hypothetical protein DBR40_15235 [Pedobacter sp. KBW01]